MQNELRPYPAYKDSGVPWLGRVPEHWEPNRLGHVATLMVPMRDKPEDLTGPIPWIRIEDFNGRSIASSRSGQGVSTGTVHAMNLKIFPVGTVLCSCSCSMGTVAIAARPLVTNQTFIGIVPGETLSSDYLFYLLQASKDYLTQIATGAIQTYLSRLDFSSLGIVVPPHSEQVVIVRYLDYADRKVRRGIHARQQLIKLLTEQKQAIIQRAVTRGLDPNVCLKPSGVAWLGDVPQHWEVRRLKTLSHMKSGESITSLEIDPTGDYPVYGGNGLRGYTSVYTHDGEYALIGRQGALCGNVHQARGRFWASEHAVVASLRDGYGLSWFCSLLDVMNLNQYSMAAAQPGLAVEQIINLWIPVPPADEQRQISDYLDAATMDLDRAIDAARHEISLLREYRTRLIADVVTGKLDVRDVPVPPDETDVLSKELESIDDVEAIDQTDDVAEGDSESSAEESA